MHADAQLHVATAKSSTGVAPATSTGVGVFMGTAAERSSVEQEFDVTFSANPHLWTESDFSPLVGGARYHVVAKCESADEQLNSTLTETLAAVIEYGHTSYPEFFVPRGDFEPPKSPTSGLPPHHVWFVRGYVDKRTRVAEKVNADGSPGQFCLVTVLELSERGPSGVGGRLKYRRPGGFEFIVTVVPLDES